MNVLRSPGNMIYALVTLLAFLGGLLVSLVLVVGFAYVGFLGVHSENVGLLAYDAAVVITSLGSVVLFVGMLGTASRKPAFATLTLLASTCLFLVTGFGISTFRGRALIWPFALITADMTAMILSALKLRQLRSLEVTR